MNEKQLQQKIKQSMDDMTDAIDVSTQVKLNQARHTALNQINNKKSWTPMLSLLGMAFAIILVVGLVWHQSPIENMPVEDEMAWLEDLDLLATEAEPEFYQDLEFLAWLEENQLMDAEI